MIQVSSFLWFEKEVDEAVAFYVSLIPNSAVTSGTVMPGDGPSGPDGSVKVVTFTLGGIPFTAMEAGPHDPFNDAFSISLECDTQAEIDSIWDAILENGGRPTACGWINDRWGVRWQVAPRAMAEMMASPDRAAAARATAAMLKMVKLDLPTLEKAFRGKA